LRPDVEARVLEMRSALEATGVAITSRRDKLLEVLASSQRHPSVNEIHREVQRFFPGASLATVYNTIELLKETDQVLEIEFSGLPNRYDGRRPHPHPHLICLNCERIDDLGMAEPDHPLDVISEATGYQILRRRTDYYGVCPQCQTKAAAD
jgi:Fur family peroxide stress response transcriptional regulator